jgi:hypothetical protein
MAKRASSRVSTDHEEIRHWAEERGAQPACVRVAGDEDDIGILHLEFRDAPGDRDESLKLISWDDWFTTFEERGLALAFQDETADSQQRNFKLVDRETAHPHKKNAAKTTRRSGGRRRKIAKRLAIAVGAGRLRSRLRQRSAKSASRKAGSGIRAVASRKKTTKVASGNRRAGRKSQPRANAGTKRSSSRKTASTKRPSNVRSITSARSGRAASTRGRVNKRSGRRAA